MQRQGGSATRIARDGKGRLDAGSARTAGDRRRLDWVGMATQARGGGIHGLVPGASTYSDRQDRPGAQNLSYRHPVGVKMSYVHPESETMLMGLTAMFYIREQAFAISMGVLLQTVNV